MQVNIQYTSGITIDTTTIPIYITSDSVVFVGLEIMPWIVSKHEIRQCIITDIDDNQYTVYPFVEVCKFINGSVLIGLNTGSIEKKKHVEIEKKEQSEFALALKKIGRPKNKGK
jgi:4-hydroxy-3-methylbut-2-en-1-yl diphosphate synthase IspG/GcpE